MRIPLTCPLTYSCHNRVIEDYIVLYFGPAIFKISRLLFFAMSCVHMFACIFFRVKKDSAESTDAVDQFYISRNVNPNVSQCFLLCVMGMTNKQWYVQDLGQTYVSKCAK
jgi:hypothetical protein